MARSPRSRAVVPATIAAVLAAAGPALAAGWLPATAVSPRGHTTMDVKARFDDAGRVVARWRFQVFGPGGGHWEAATWHPGSGWGQVSGEAGYSDDSPSYADSDLDGILHAVDIRVFEDQGMFYWSRPADGSWSPQRDLVTDGLGAWEFRGTAAVGLRGGECIIWGGDSGTAHTLTRRAGGAWTRGTTTGDFESGSARIALMADGDGCLTAAWWNADGTLYFRDYAVGVGWLPRQRIDTAGAITTDPLLAVDRAGNSTLVWSARSGGLRRVLVSQRPPGGGWSPATVLTPPGHDAFIPALDVHPDGTAVVAWVHAKRAWATLKPLGGTWSTPRALSGASEDVRLVTAAAGGGRNAAVAWTRALGTTRTPAAAVHRDGEDWGAPQDLFPASAADDGWTSLTVDLDRSGNGVAAWTDGGVQARIFDATAPELTLTEAPASATTGATVRFAATASDAVSGIPAGITWRFDDGTTAGGQAVDHAFATPGPHAVEATVTDGAGNSITRTATTTVSSPGSPRPPIADPSPVPGTGTNPGSGTTAASVVTIASATVNMRWVGQRLSGRVRVTGTASAATALAATVRATGGLVVTVDPRSRGMVVQSRSISVAAGAFSADVALPSTLLPGVYAVEVSDGAAVRGSATFTVPVPALGISGSPALRRSRLGARVRLEARFPFVVRPAAGARITTQWLRAGSAGPRVPAANARVMRSAITVPASRAQGWRCVLRVNGVVVDEVR